MSNRFEDELKKLEESIQADNEWIELRSHHRMRLREFFKTSEELVGNIDTMLKICEREFTINGSSDELAAMGNDMAKDALIIGTCIKLIGDEARGFADRAKQLERDIRSHTENVR